MQVIDSIDALRQSVHAWKRQGETVGLVPTMGFLHEGHASLVKKAREMTDRVVVSVFVNPTQFGPNEDFDAYPRDLGHDKALLESLGVDVMFAPKASEMYAADRTTWVTMDVLNTTLCGVSRPIHFRGVCTVVSKLFNIVMPDFAFFGEKDAQQLAIIRRMVRDLSYGITIVGCPIVREVDGLAKSSRNTYLSAEERRSALILNKALNEGKALCAKGAKDTASVLVVIRAKIQEEAMARIDYVEAVDSVTMQPVKTFAGDVLFAVAVYFGKTRLIDNFTWHQGS